MKINKYFYLILILVIQISNTMKVIHIMPGGLYGFYMFGVCKFIKENYNLNDYIFYGASAGSWNSLYMCLKNNNDDKFIESIIQETNEHNNLQDLQINIKNNLLDHYSEQDFDFKKLHITLCTLEKKPLFLKKNIVNDFDNLEDAINCCIASSHIPFVCGNLYHIYKMHKCIDGGVFRKPFSSYKNKPKLVINYELWKNEKIKNHNSLRKNNLKILFDEGYEDSIKNKYILDEIFRK